MPFSLGYITCPDKDIAETLARLLLEKRLIACANILSPMQALFRWEGRVDAAQEIPLLIKTQQKHENAIIRLVKDHHPYTCPCIVFTTLHHGAPEFLNWIMEQTTS